VAAAFIARVNDDPSLIISDYHDFHGKSCHTPFFKKCYEGDPLSPPEGEAACGGYPLDPRLHLSRLSREILVNLQRAIAIFMNASSGAGVKVVQLKRAS
jgi:hypothetical protein